MKRALISDIHANSEALEKVLEDIRQQGVTEIYCLGDIIGYGPNPCECLDQVMQECAITILGNHDQAALFDPDGFNPVALQAVYWTREQLERRDVNARLADARWDFLGELPRSYSDGEFLYVHGSPREPTNEYVFPEDVYNQRKMDALFDRIERYCFQGHTHIPGVFTASGEFITPDECDSAYRLIGDKAMFNVGSVGQPRDGDPRAAYGIYNPEEASFHIKRVPYDIKRTQEKIIAARLPPFLASRLDVGR